MGVKGTFDQSTSTPQKCFLNFMLGRHYLDFPIDHTDAPWFLVVAHHNMYLMAKTRVCSYLHLFHVIYGTPTWALRELYLMPSFFFQKKTPSISYKDFIDEIIVYKSL